MQTNKPRLQAVESLVPKGARLLDIGADHGLLPLTLLARGDIKCAFLTDINKGPLSACQHRALITCPNKMDKISFAISDGFQNVPKNSYNFVTICGMGGELIAKIIEEGGEKARKPMVLQPMSHHEKLREYLWTHGYAIRKELFPMEGNRSYLVMLVKYTGRNTVFYTPDAYLGKKRPKTAAYASYANRVLHAAKKRYEGERLEGNWRAGIKTKCLINAATKCLYYR